MAKRVIRRDTDLNNRIGSKPARWTMDRSKWQPATVFRIEWPDGTPTDTGLFASLPAAQQYAREHGWRVDIEDMAEEDCA
jgi:hypothetical protein